jgi:hypothetical protein
MFEDGCEESCTIEDIYLEYKHSFYKTNTVFSQCARVPDTCLWAEDGQICMELNGEVQCDQCPSGYFGAICNESCHEGCQDQLCNKYGFVKVAQGVIIMIHKVYQHVQSVQKIVMIQIQLIPYVNL